MENGKRSQRHDGQRVVSIETLDPKFASDSKLLFFHFNRFKPIRYYDNLLVRTNSEEELCRSISLENFFRRTPEFVKRVYQQI